MNEAISSEVNRCRFEFEYRSHMDETLATADLGRHVRFLTTMVLDLMMEVEALREAAATGAGYRDAYRRTGLLTHDSTGPSDGWMKLVDCYYPRERETTGRAWRETLMLRRLGAPGHEIDAYRQEAMGMEART